MASRLDVCGEIFEFGLGLVSWRRGRQLARGPFAFASSSTAPASASAVGSGPRRLVRRYPDQGTRSGRHLRRGRPSGGRFRLREEDPPRGPAIPRRREECRRRTPVRRSAAARGVEHSLARPPGREVAGVLGLDRAAARAFPAAADPRYPAGDRARAAVGVRSRIRLGRAARVPDDPPRGPGWAGPRAAVPTLPLGNGSPLSLRAAGVAHRAAEGPRNQARRQSHRVPAPGSISGLEGPSLSAGGTGRDRPGGGDGRPRPRPRLGSRPPGDSISGSPGPASVLGHSSTGERSGGGTRCRPRSCPSISPGRVGPAGPRSR